MANELKVDLTTIAGTAPSAAGKLDTKTADGDDAAVGATADVVAAAGGTGSLSAKLRRATQGLEDLKTLIVLAAGAAVIGKVGIDQTTPGTTNRVDVGAALPAGDNNIGNVDLVTLPAGNLGQQAVAASLSTAPATNIADATYLGDIKFGEALPAGEAHLGSIGGHSVAVNGSFTRPNDATAYASGDAVTDSTATPTVITFANCARVNNGSGVVLGAVLVDSANQATKGAFELWLFDTTVTADNDNAVFTPTDAELATLIGIIPLNTVYVGDATAGAGGNCVYPVTGLSVPFVCTGAAKNIFGVLVARSAYTPVALEVFTIRLRIAQD